MEIRWDRHMILREKLSASIFKDNFKKCVNYIMYEKPILVQRGKDAFWSISQEMLRDMLDGFMIAIDFEQKKDGSFYGTLIPFGDIVAHGKTIDDMVDNAAEQLIVYAQEYYENFNAYYNNEKQRSHLPYIINILSRRNIEEVRKLIQP